MSSGAGQQRRLGGRYELGEIIGQGGMSTVYRSYDHQTARAVAVKVFHAAPEVTDADERFRREVMLLAGLHDPGIVTVFDAELEVAAPYLVTELVDGPTLLQRIRQAPLTEAQVTHLGAALARTLAYVHAHGIVHRDVKPSNILLPSVAEDPFTAPKLVDFGIAIAADATRLTAVNLTLGTANYLSPEQLRGEPLTPATDVYSLGLVLIEALSGQPAYPGIGLEATMARLDHPPPAVPAITSATLHAALTDMTAPDPQDRPHAAQLARRLDGLETSRTTPLTRSGAAASTELLGRAGTHAAGRAQRRPRRWHTVAAGAALIAALAGVAAAAGVITHKPDHPANQPPPEYVAPTTGTSPAPTRAATARPRTPTSASAPQQVPDPAPSTAPPTTPSRRPATMSGPRPTAPKTPSVSDASPSTSRISTSPSTPTATASSVPSTPSTPESPSDLGSPSTPPATSPPPSPTP
jgi:eukaryotic-like serine/threonine-protein kinase